MGGWPATRSATCGKSRPFQTSQPSLQLCATDVPGFMVQRRLDQCTSMRANVTDVVSPVALRTAPPRPEPVVVSDSLQAPISQLTHFAWVRIKSTSPRIFECRSRSSSCSANRIMWRFRGWVKVLDFASVIFDRQQIADFVEEWYARLCLESSTERTVLSRKVSRFLKILP